MGLIQARSRRTAATGNPGVPINPAGHDHGMATRGQEHFKRAEELISYIEHEKNETERAQRVQLAQVHATLALVAAVIQSGHLTEKQIREWGVFGVKF